MKLVNDLKKVERVLASCKTRQHLEVAKRMVYNFYFLHKDDLDANSKHIKTRINSALDKAVIGLTQ